MVDNIGSKCPIAVICATAYEPYWRLVTSCKDTLNFVSALRLLTLQQLRSCPDEQTTGKSLSVANEMRNPHYEP